MFNPAMSKLQAVNRISALTYSGEETLGPGSKERKSVLTNLAQGLGLVLDARESKQSTARIISKHLGCDWTPKCESRGQTITLEGLNLLLAYAEMHFAKKTVLTGKYLDPSDEAEAMKSVFEKFLNKKWVGKIAVGEMKDADYVNWRQTEWPGWYFEYLSIPRLVGSLGGGRRRVMNTDFDYALQRTWDLKTHSNRMANGRLNSECILNDLESMDFLIKSEGLGLVILCGDADYKLSFGLWHKALRGKTGAPRRKLKSSFTPTHLKFYWIENDQSLEMALKSGAIKVFKQGVQPNGMPRKVKYQINIEHPASKNFLLLDHTFSIKSE